MGELLEVMIDIFDKEYAFLSNFYEVPLTYQGNKYQNSEAAFQSMKTLDYIQRLRFRDLNPSAAKKLGRKIDLRPDWDNIKDQIMYEIVKAKFDQNPELQKQLLETKNEELVEGNYWHDNYWGNCTCNKCKDIKGQNKLGKILMAIRDGKNPLF